MELKSTASFKDIDIDAMLEHTTFDDFMKGLYMNKVSQTKTTKTEVQKTDFELMWQSVMVSEKEDTGQDLRLKFEGEKDEDAQGDDMILNQALANVRQRRKLLNKSRIFDGSEKKQVSKVPERQKDLENQIDLTSIQEEQQTEQITEIDDDLDILDANIDPFDLKSQKRKMRIMNEIDDEKIAIKAKFLFNYGRNEGDPFRLWS